MKQLPLARSPRVAVKRPGWQFYGVGTLVLTMSCASSLEVGAKAEQVRIAGDWQALAQARRGATTSHTASVVKSLVKLSVDGSLGSYVAYALKNSPRLRSAFFDWRAATLSISRARRLPDPVLTYGLYLRRVETRVGPQRHRFSLSQVLPWPTQLSAGSDAAAARAQAQHRQFDAQVLRVVEHVSHAFWDVWRLDEENRLMLEHDKIMETLAGTIRGRVESGQASLAELNQVNLKVARHHDHHDQHHQARRAAEATLLAAIGAAAPSLPLTISDSPGEPQLRQSDEDLQQAVQRHPKIERIRQLAQASHHRARAEAAHRLPSLRLGIDYIETGDALDPTLSGSGNDPLIVSMGVSLPLWQGNYADAERAQRATAAARTADARTATLEAHAELTATLAQLRNAHRRIVLCRGTLIPQAETTFLSVLGSYQTGRSQVAASLMAQRDLLELELELVRMRVKRAKAWATLERVVGRALASLPAQELPDITSRTP